MTDNRSWYRELELEPLLYRIHASSNAGGDMTEALALLRDRMDARLATLSRHHFVSGHGEVLCDTPASPGFRSAYAEFAPRNPWFLSSDEYTPGRVLTGDEVLSNRDLVKTDFYRALLEPRGLLHCVAGVAVRHGPLIHYVNLLRGQDQPAFGEREKANLRTVLAHVSLALGNRWRQREAADLVRVLTGVIDHHPHPCLLVDRDGQLVHGNRSATAQALESVGLCLDAGVVTAALPADRATLRQAIRDVAAARTVQPAGDATRAVMLSVPCSRHPSMVSLHPAGDVFDAASGEFTALVLITAPNPGLDHDLRTCSFVRQFGLSPAQARVGVMIVSGHSLTETARKLHVSENTVRSHLKQIFQKTNTHGQVELVHLHARICAASD
ncbi:MAG: helix-turn-helix transcriptional regulator [Betaproteobacteria bacterium]|nr:helix-turn-helix transcriptional regulator [Betaproteobacteria bacterium]